MPQIEAFSDIGEFIDQPVKIYSTGMFLRLAFAAAINIEPDILVIDEVLAVGDAKFQQKCYQKFLDLQNKGTTIILVTHDSNAIVRHCDYAMLIEKGSIIDRGNPKDVMNHYNNLLFADTIDSKEDLFSSITDATKSAEVKQLSDNDNNARLEMFLKDTSKADKCVSRRSYNKNESKFMVKNAEIIDYLIISGQECDPIAADSGDTIDLYAKAIFYEDILFPVFGFAVKTMDGITIYANNTDYMKIKFQSAHKSDIVVFKLSIKIDLKAGDYFFTIGLAEKHATGYSVVNARQDVIHLLVKEKNIFDGIVELKTTCQEVSRKSI
jgi:lipopolysaccharide transport system ATP-binding protein